MEMIIQAYKDIHETPPTELFIHGKTNFDADEWTGFASAVPQSTKLVGVQIRDNADVKVFRYGANAVLRGTAVLTSETSGYLWTRGYIPRLRTYPGREVPNPLTVEIRRGDADIEQVMRDVMSLTKLNFNAAEFCDGSAGHFALRRPGRRNTHCRSDHVPRAAALQVLHLSPMD